MLDWPEQRIRDEIADTAERAGTKRRALAGFLMLAVDTWLK